MPRYIAILLLPILLSACGLKKDLTRPSDIGKEKKQHEELVKG